jgi:hypothetical protein
MIPEPDAEKSHSRDPAQWRARLAADLAADLADQRKTWGEIDEIILARDDARTCTREEHGSLEQAMHDFPAVREAVEIARLFPLECETETRSPQNAWDTVRTALAAFRARPRLSIQIAIIFIYITGSIVFFQVTFAPVAPRLVGVGTDSGIDGSSSSQELGFPPLISVSRGYPPPGRQAEIEAMELLFREVKRGRLKP